eukprot:5561261-Pleurochrysis_carterae.AAC.2
MSLSDNSLTNCIHTAKLCARFLACALRLCVAFVITRTDLPRSEHKGTKQVEVRGQTDNYANENRPCMARDQ